MFGDCLHLEPSRHELLKDGAWVKKVREVVNNDRIFVYRHRETEQFVVCEWLDKPREYGMGLATCTELFTVDAPPDHSPTNMPDMPTIMHRCRPITEMFKERTSQILEKQYKRAAGEVESNMQRLDAAKWLDKQGMDEAAAHHREGCAPYAAEGQSLGLMDETVEELNSLASSKVYSTGVVGEKPAPHKL